MATFRKRNSKWQAIVRQKDIGTIAKSFSTKSAAKKWAFDQELRLEAGSFGKLCPQEVTLHDLLERYAKEITPSKRGAAPELRRLKRLMNDPISGYPIDKLTSPVLSKFRDRRLQDGQRACQYDLIIIRHCLKIATYEWGLMLADNPVEFIQLPASPKPRNRRLVNDEFARLELAARHTLNPHIWPVVVFALETAMRRGEILALTWDHICVEERLAFLPITKNGSSRDVPLTHRAVDILKTQLEAQTPRPFPVSDNAFRLAWNRLRKRGALQDLRFHDLRHEAISRFFERGLNIAEVAIISGHKDPRMLFRYTHLRASDLLTKID